MKPLTRPFLGLVSLALIGAISPAFAEEPEIPSLNRGVLEYAREQIGQEVGDGECTGLVVAALSHAGARARPRPGSGAPAWGRRVATLTPQAHPTEEIRPGDILQFRDVKLVTVTRRRGAIRTETQAYAQHAAIVAEVSGGTLKVLHQNVVSAGSKDKDKKPVRYGVLRLDDMKQGTLWVDRPVAE
jgi:hypothetical protein